MAIGIGALKHKTFYLLTSKKNVSVSANTNIINDITISNDGFVILEIISDTAGNPILVKDGLDLPLNEASNLTANALYSFWIPVSAGCKLNLKFSTNATISFWLYFSEKI